MTTAYSFLPPDRLTQPWLIPDQALILIDLQNADPAVILPTLPPVPVIGIGDEGHPWGAQLDMVAASLEQAHHALANISRHPLAAAMLVQLLRQIDHRDTPHDLTIESFGYSVLQGSSEHQTWLQNRRPSRRYAHGQVRAERLDDNLHILLDRPEAYNQIDRPMRDQLREYFELGALDDSITQIRMTGLGRSFCAGADLSEFGTTRDPMTAHQIRLATLPAHAMAACAHKLAVHVQGACIGSGLEMAAFAHRLTATPNAWFQLPELAMGLIPGAGGCSSVMRRIGRQKMGQLVLSGRRISAATALEWGLVDALISDVSTDHRHADAICG